MSEFWRHKKRGSVYEVISTGAFMQCSTFPHVEEAFSGTSFTIYKRVDAIDLFFVRPTNEFMDGRFEKIEAPDGYAGKVSLG